MAAPGGNVLLRPDVAMWQQIVAVDSRTSKLRTAMTTKEGGDLRPLYLKRRMQLLQGKRRSTSLSGVADGVDDAKQHRPICDPDIVDDAGGGNY